MRKTILVVEDDLDMQNYFSFVLARKNVDVLTAGNGLEALTVVDSGRPIDLILLDIIMPVMDGEEFFRVLRHERKSSIPVIVCSVDDNRARALSNVGEVQGIFAKGNHQEELTNLINNLYD